MRVCILTTSYPRYKGDPAGVFVSRLVDSLACGGVETRVVAPGHQGIPSFEQSGRTSIHRFTYFWPSLQRVAYGPGGLPEALVRDPLAMAQVPWFITAFLQRLIPVARDCHVIHANWLLAGLCAALARDWVGRPVVVTLRGTDGQWIRRSGFVRWLARWVFDRSDAVTAVSGGLAGICLKTGCPASKVTVIPNGVQLPPPAVGGCSGREEGGGGPTILFVGNLTQNKGLEVLLRALPLVMQRIPAARAAVVGRGPEEGRLKELARALGLADRVRWVGWCPPDQVYRWYRNAQVLACPSFSEGRPNAILEAMSCRLPVVAAAVDGVREVVLDGSTGFLCPAGDALALAERLALVLLQPALAARLGEKGYLRLIRLGLTWEKSAASYLRVFEKAVTAAERNGSAE